MKKVLCYSTLLVLFATMGLPGVVAGQEAANPEPAAANNADQAVPDAEANGAADTEEQANDAQRLPPGYGDIITSSQRRSIYKIQERVQGEIEALQAQITALLAKRDAEIEAVLDDQQKQILKYILMIRERNRKELAEAQQKEQAASQADAEASADAAPANAASE